MPTKIEIYTASLQRAEAELKRLMMEFALRISDKGTDRNTQITKAIATEYYPKAIAYQEGAIADLRRELEQENTKSNERQPRRTIEELDIARRDAQRESIKEHRRKNAEERENKRPRRGPQSPGF
jgi:hypothetical protein